MGSDRITRITVAGLRCFEAVEFDLRGLNVLIGDNGTGKSTLLEAFELLRKAGGSTAYVDEVLSNQHGPFKDLLRAGADRMTLGVVVEGDGPKLDYRFTIALAGVQCTIVDERLDVVDPTDAGAEPLHALVRDARGTRWFDESKGALVDAGIDANKLAAASAAQGLVRQAAFVRLNATLSAIEYHPAFDVRPVWQQRELQMLRTGPRWPAPPEPAERVRRYGQNLPAALLALRNHGGETWEQFLQRARAAVEIDLVDISFEPAGGGQLDAVLKFRSPRPPLPLRALSEGQLSYLAMIATLQLGEGRTALVLDEPDIHYHPELSVNLMQLIEVAAESHPVIVATHSDRMLDALEHPADSVLLCERDAQGAVRLRRPNPAALARWLERYRGLGAVRADGYEAHVFDEGPVVGAEPRP